MHRAAALSLLLALFARPASSLPILVGSGLEPDAATGTFGSTGSIFEYRVQGSPGLAFSFSQTSGLEGLRLSYACTAPAALAAVSAAVYLDADINQDANTWFNERGEAMAAPGGADNWEIDEPGFGADYVGDIFLHYAAGSFDNSIFNGRPGLVEDVAFGLGFTPGALGVGDQLLLEILISENAIGAGWGTVLHQWDDADGPAGDNLYLAGRYSIQRAPDDPNDPGVIPEPSGIALFGLGFALLALRRRRR